MNSSTQVCDCKAGYFDTTGVQICSSCDDSCLSCNGPGVTNCLTCDPAQGR